MGFVGLTERFDESLVLMKYYLNFTDIRYTHHLFFSFLSFCLGFKSPPNFLCSYGSDVKVGKKKPGEIEDGIRDKIKEKNKMDIELYEMAKKRFDEEMDELSRFLLRQEMKHS